MIQTEGENMKLAKTFFQSLFFAGLIVLLIGLYYAIIKAGIPYHDAPLELQIQYAINMGIGDVLTRDGLLLSALGLIAWLILGKIQRKALQEGRKGEEHEGE